MSSAEPPTRLPAPRVPAGAPHRRVRLRTRWSDEDNHAVLNNAVYATLLEEARLALFGAAGLLEGKRFPFVLAGCNARFLRPGRGGVEVDVEVWTTHVGTSSLSQSYRVVPAGGGEPWCEAEALLVGWDHATGAKGPWTAAFRAAATELARPEAGGPPRSAGAASTPSADDRPRR